MIRLLTRRATLAAVTLLLVTIIVFSVTAVLPGDVALAILGENATADSLASLRERLGLNAPLHVQYFNWLGNLLSGSFGQSLFYDKPIAPLLLERIWSSFALAMTATAVIIPLALTLGIVAALRPGSLADRAIELYAFIALSTPEFVVAALAIILFAGYLQWFPAVSLIEADTSFAERFAMLVLPAGVLAIDHSPYIARMLRANLIDALNSSFVRAARLNGVSPFRIVMVHAFPVGLLRSVNVIALTVGRMLAGLVVIETIFTYPGLGRLMISAIENRDVTLLQACVIVIAATYIVVNLAADLLQMAMDPQAR